MITDAMLREAAGEAERFLLAHLPESQPHHFSPRFERRMRKLISRANHPVRYLVLRYVAAVLLAVFTLFGAILAVSPEARASVNGWIRRPFFDYLYYFYKGEDKTAMAEYELTAVPKGYQLVDVIQSEGGKTYLYLKHDRSVLEFRYVCAAGTDHYFISIKDFDQHSVTVNGVLADVYISKKEDDTNVIVWQDPSENVVFHIFAEADKAALIELAESVQKTN